MKSDNKDTFPLCIVHHTAGGFGVAIHSGVKTWEKNFGSQDYWIEKTQSLLDEIE